MCPQSGAFSLKVLMNGSCVCVCGKSVPHTSLLFEAFFQYLAHVCWIWHSCNETAAADFAGHRSVIGWPTVNSIITSLPVHVCAEKLQDVEGVRHIVPHQITQSLVKASWHAL